MDIPLKELEIPEKYLTITEDKICATVHKKWISGFLNLNPVKFIMHHQLIPDEIAAQPSLDELGTSWSRVYIKVFTIISNLFFFSIKKCLFFFSYRFIKKGIKMFLLYPEKDVPLQIQRQKLN